MSSCCPHSLHKYSISNASSVTVWTVSFLQVSQSLFSDISFIYHSHSVYHHCCVALLTLFCEFPTKKYLFPEGPQKEDKVFREKGTEIVNFTLDSNVSKLHETDIRIRKLLLFPPHIYLGSFLLHHRKNVHQEFLLYYLESLPHGWNRFFYFSI